nr:uncharacterized mitochondrial protein AtMg00810-like [Tanacetum cinerariifolium]
MLKKFGLEDSKPTKTPMSMEIKITKDNEAESMDGINYRGERKPRKGQNWIKIRQKREACRSQEKFKAVAVDKGRKTEENAKRMVENAYTVKKLFKL